MGYRVKPIPAMADGTSPAEQERVLLQELGAYQPQLLERPRIVIGSRADLEGSVHAPQDFDGLRISAVTGAGLGLIDIARKSTAPLTASLAPLDATHVFFSLRATI